MHCFIMLRFTIARLESMRGFVVNKGIISTTNCLSFYLYTSKF